MCERYWSVWIVPISMPWPTACRWYRLRRGAMIRVIAMGRRRWRRISPTADHVSAGIRQRLGVPGDIAIAVRSLHGVGAGELAHHRIVVPRVEIAQPRRILHLPGVAMATGHAANGIAHVAIRAEQLLGQHVPAGVEIFADAAQRVGHQVRHAAIHRRSPAPIRQCNIS